MEATLPTSTAPDRTCQRNARSARLAALATAHAPGVSVPLRFIAAGLLALVIAAGWLVLEPALIVDYHYGPHVVAFTHLVLLGFIVSVVMGVLYQLAPVVLQTRLYSERLARVQFWFQVIGVAGMVWMFHRWDMREVGRCGSVFGVGVLLFIYNLARTLARVPRWNVVAVGIASALGWLLVTMLAGLFLACVKCWPWIAHFAPVPQMHAHAHLGVLGVFVLLVVTIAYRLVPMFAISEIQNERRAGWSIGLLNAGVAGLVVTILAGSPWKLAFALISIFGLALFGAELIAILRVRKRRMLDWGLKYFLTGTALLAPISLLAIALCWPGLPATQFTRRLENAYAIIALFGVLTFAILGMLHKILPFLIWFHRYSGEVGRNKVPSLAEMVSQRLQAVGYWLYVAGLVIVTSAATLGHVRCARVGAALMLASVFTFALNAIRIGSHAFHHPTAPPHATGPATASA